jgi:oligopeptide/dipeptide ABC transporter ATP-binding protein
VVTGLNLIVDPAEIVGLVGESGSGKTMTARTIVGALPSRAVVEGSVTVQGEELVGASLKRLRKIRGKQIGMIFQDPRAYIDPLWRVGTHMTEAMTTHLGMSRSEARRRAIELLGEVGLDRPQQRIHQYPGELSGGMLQRVMIAGALAVEPNLLLADEATTALDVTTQAEIVKLISQLRATRGLSVLFITHDLALASSICDRVCVMYAGRLVEQREGSGIFDDPRHPYTQGLLAARPDLFRKLSRLKVISGNPTTAMEAPQGCAFHPRCPYADEQCRSEVPLPVAIAGGMAVCRRIDHVPRSKATDRGGSS